MEQLMQLSDQELIKRAEYFGLTIQEPINRGRLIEELAEAEAIAQTAIEQGEVYQPEEGEEDGGEGEEDGEDNDTEEGGEEGQEELRELLKQTYKVTELRELLKQAGVKIPAKALKDDLIDLYIENVVPTLEGVATKPGRYGLPLESDLETLNQVRQNLNPEPINPNATFQQNRPLPPPTLAPLATVKMPILKAPGRAPIVITTTGTKVTVPAPVMIKPTTTPPEEETVVPVPIPKAASPVVPKATPKIGLKINLPPVVKTPAKMTVPIPKTAVRTPSPAAIVVPIPKAAVRTPSPAAVTVPKVGKATPKLGLKINLPPVTPKATPKATPQAKKTTVPLPKVAVKTPSPAASPPAKVVVPIPVLTPVATPKAAAKAPKLTLAKAAPKLTLTISTGTAKKITPKMAPPKSPVAIAVVEEGVLPFLSEEQVKRKKIDDLKKDFQEAGIDFKGVKLKNDFVQLYLKNMAPAVGAVTPSPSPAIPKRAVVITTTVAKGKTTLPTGTVRPIGGMTLPPPQFPAIIPKIAPEIERETVFEATIPIFETRMSPLPLPEPEQVTADDQAPTVLTTEQMAFLGLGDIDPKRLTKTRVKKEDEAKYYSREDMINIARGLNLRVTGTKAELYDRIMDKLRAAGYVKD
jgi:hypothetical protein